MPFTPVNKSKNYFDTIQYTGTGSSNTVTGTNFTPSLTWIKSKASATGHRVIDNVRGITKKLTVETSGTQTTDTQSLTAFNNNGFTIGTSSDVNTNADTYISWNWLANSSTALNTSGTINSNVALNSTAGFSIVSWTGNGTNGATVGTGLSSLDCVIVKDLDNSTGNWVVKHKSLTGNDNVFFNSNIKKDNAASAAVTPSFQWDMSWSGFAHSERGYFIMRQASTGATAYVDRYDFSGNLIETLSTSFHTGDIYRLKVTGTGNWVLLLGQNSAGNAATITAWYLSNSARNRQHLPNKSYSSGEVVLAQATSDGLWYLWTANTTTSATPDNSVASWTKGAAQTVTWQLNTGTQSYGSTFQHFPSVCEIGERASDGYLVGGLYTNTSGTSPDGAYRDKLFYIPTSVTTSASLYNDSASGVSHRGSAWAISTRSGAVTWGDSRDPVQNQWLSSGVISDSRGLMGFSPAVANPGPAGARQKEGLGNYISFVAAPLDDLSEPYNRVWYQYNDFDGTSGSSLLDGDSSNLIYNISNTAKKYVSHMAGGKSYAIWCMNTNGSKVWTIKKATTAGNFGTTTNITTIAGANLDAANIQPNAFLWKDDASTDRRNNRLWLTDEDRSTDAFTICEFSQSVGMIRRWRCTSSSVTQLSSLTFPQTTPAAAGGGVGALTTGLISTVLGSGGSSLFQTNKSGANYIAYCFKQTAGFSHFGSYTGTGISDGPFNYLGFKPALVIIKRTDASGDWIVYDNKRAGYNPTNNFLNINSTAAETTGSNQVDFLSTGFKLKSTTAATNNAASTYIYMAFAEEPLVSSNSLVATAR